jgi:hypothetical protein
MAQEILGKSSVGLWAWEETEQPLIEELERAALKLHWRETFDQSFHERMRLTYWENYPWPGKEENFDGTHFWNGSDFWQ